MGNGCLLQVLKMYGGNIGMLKTYKTLDLNISNVSLSDVINYTSCTKDISNVSSKVFKKYINNSKNNIEENNITFFNKLYSVLKLCEDEKIPTMFVSLDDLKDISESTTFSKIMEI